MADFIADTINHTLTHIPTGTVFALPKYEGDAELSAIILEALEEIENGRALTKADTRTGS